MVCDGEQSSSVTSPERCIFELAIFDHIWSRCDLELLTSKSKSVKFPHGFPQMAYLTAFCLAVTPTFDLMISKSK